MAEGDHNREPPIQMSPFSHSRWDIDEELARRRKQEHYDNVMPKKLRKPSSSIEKEFQQRLVISDDSKPENQVKEVKSEPLKPKTQPPQPPPLGKIEKLPFDVPPPPNLFPVIKFAERSGKTPEKAENHQSTDAAANAHDNIVLPPKIVFREVLPKKANPVGNESKEKLKIYHYGAQMPFWPASAKDLDH